MDYVLEFLHYCLPVLYILAGLALIFKMFITFRVKGFNLPAFVMSFFRIYNRREKDTATSQKRLRYMVLNNYINYYLYAFVFIFIILLLIFQKDL